MKGKKGDEVLYASHGLMNKHIGDKKRDKFLINSDRGHLSLSRILIIKKIV
ncbi:hypothetical protein SynRS9902_02087 [Synechococcus sp. RS9902]|nr:hypothetical protein SynRS9902_02087 [Synechococcus sp. RS9902]